MTLLRQRSGTAATALEFLILTASRTNEVIGDKRINNRGMVWSEVDLDAKLWTIPKSRMKMSRDHKVVLCDRAVELLKTLPAGSGDTRVFPGPGGQIASDGYLRSVIKRIRETELEQGRDLFRDRATGKPATTHGFRSTFKTWASECTSFEREAVELSMSHKEGNKVVAAYDRSDMIDKRRPLMAAWQDMCDNGISEKGGTVVPITGRSRNTKF